MFRLGPLGVLKPRLGDLYQLRWAAPLLRGARAACFKAFSRPGLKRSYVRSLKLDQLKDHEWQLLLSSGNDAFQDFLCDSQSVSRKVWMSLPLETRYHTPAADLYRCLFFRNQ